MLRARFFISQLPVPWIEPVPLASPAWQADVVTITPPALSVTAKYLESFKTRQDKLWYTQDIVYDLEAPLKVSNNRTGTRILY